MQGRTLATIALSLVVGASEAQQVVREGAGPRREALDKLERTPFEASHWGHLSSWSPKEVTAGDVSGKVVLIVTWAGWYPSAMQALPVAQEMHRKYSKEGLVVVGVHHPQGFEGAAAKASGRGVGFAIAHDAEGKFREALKVDQDPDFYLIDRAGQLRYADIATGSVEEAVKELVAESRQDAAALNDRLAEAARAAEQAFRQTVQINQEIDLRELPEVSFDQPTDRDWQAVQERWPEIADSRGERRPLRNPPVVSIPEGLIRHPRIPATAGRAQVIYFWSPNLVSVESQLLEPMNRLQRQHARDVVVVSVLGPLETRRSSRQEEEEAELQRRMAEVMERMARSGRLNHSLVFDPQSSYFQSLEQNRELEFRRNTQVGEATGFVLVTDSAGRLRWWGVTGDPSFRAALDQVLRIDPGIRNRRQAEAEYIRARGQ